MKHIIDHLPRSLSSLTPLQFAFLQHPLFSDDVSCSCPAVGGAADVQAKRGASAAAPQATPDGNYGSNDFCAEVQP